MEKKELRRSIMHARRALPIELLRSRSQSIAEQLFGLDDYKKSETILCFVSTRIEVDTSPILTRAFADGKKVAAPRCRTDSNQMDFYYINSRDDLEPAAYNLLEPVQHCEKAESFSRAICIVPGLAYNTDGHRLGFGKGYYDRFLKGFDGVTCGLIFDENIRDDLPVEPDDVPVMVVVSETQTFFTGSYEPIG